ncbi:MAG: CapA family protein [Thermomicrobiales bacterium]
MSEPSMTDERSGQSEPNPAQRIRLHRRALIGGAAATGLVATGRGRASAAPSAPMTPRYRTWQAANLPDGMAIVTSPRLPLFGIGENDIPGLINGQTVDWNAVGSPVRVGVDPVAIEGAVPDGMTPIATFPNYAELASYLGDNPGAFAMVPVDDVDFRVNVLSVSGYDPLRDRDDVARIAFVGDIVPGRNVSAKSRYYGDWSRPFRKIAAELQTYDAVIANLEGNVSANITPPTDAHTFSFVAEPEFLEGLVFAGIDAVSLANNHSAWNADGWGLSAFNDTRTELDNYGIPYFSGGDDLVHASAPFVIETKGMRIAVTGVDGVTANDEQSLGVLSGNVGATMGQAGTNPYVTDYFTGDMRDLSAQYDVVIPYFHMGSVRSDTAGLGAPGRQGCLRCRRDDGRHQPSAPDPGDGVLRRQADRLLRWKLRVRSDVQQRSADRHDSRIVLQGWRRRGRASERRGDRRFPPAAPDEFGRARVADGPVLAIRSNELGSYSGDNDPARFEQGRSFVLSVQPGVADPGQATGQPVLRSLRRRRAGPRTSAT